MTIRKRTSLFLDAALSEGLKALKERDGIAEAEAIRRAVAAFLREKGIKFGELRKADRKRVGARKRS